MTVTIEIVPKIHDLLYDDELQQYYVIAGGRGKGATWSIARYLVEEAMKSKQFIMCVREVQSSIKHSSKKTIEDTITDLGLRPFFKFMKLETICKLTGSKFVYSGLSDQTAGSIKGLESANIVWVAESQNISSKSLKVLLPTVRVAGSRILFDINPEDDEDPVFEYFIANEAKVDGVKVCHVNYRDNPWFTKELERCRINDKRVLSKEDYEWVWEGKTRRYTDAQIFANYFTVEDYDDVIPMEGRKYFYGVDWGYAKDPTACVRMFFYEGYLCIDAESRKVECGLDNTPELFDKVMLNRRDWCKADSARPETIEWMNKRGFRIKPAKKGANSIGDGILRLKRYRNIYIHKDRCPETAKEFYKYSWKVNKQTEKIIKVPEDKFNHSIDAIRYATEGKEYRAGRIVSGKKKRK